MHSDLGIGSILTDVDLEITYASSDEPIKVTSNGYEFLGYSLPDILNQIETYERHTFDYAKKRCLTDLADALIKIAQNGVPTSKMRKRIQKRKMPDEQPADDALDGFLSSFRITKRDVH